MHAQGPGVRYTIWTQGCSIHCPDCSNKDTWDPKKGQEYAIDELVYDILMTPGLDGVTITGGEPLDQFQETFILCKKLYGKISIFLTTGYTEEQLYEKGLYLIKSFVDIICTGPFEQDMICVGEWKGSSNQELRFLTSRGRDQENYPKVLKEIFISPTGMALETGFTA